MAFLQFLNGTRDQQYEELHATASNFLGAAAEGNQIQLEDPGISPQHCQIYPSDGKYWLKDLGHGSTVIKMRRIGPNNPPDTVPLEPGTVFILGQTYVKFWAEKPAGGAGGGGGADPAALAAAQEQVSKLEAELEAARASEGQAGELQQQLDAAKQEAEEAQQRAQSLEEQLEAAKQEASETKQELAAAQGELAEAKQAAEQAQQEAEQAVEQAKQEAEQAVEQAKQEAERAVEEAKQAAEAERAESESALDAARAALSGLQAYSEVRQRDSLRSALEPSDLQAILEALAPSQALRDRLEQAVEAEVTREVLRRSEGPVVPLRGLRLAESERDLEAEIRAVKRHAEQVACARDLGLGDLEPDELQRLLTMARD